MPVSITPRPLPLVLLSRDLGRNAIRQAGGAGLVRVHPGVFARRLDEASRWQRAEHVALARVAGVSRRLTNGAVFSHRTAALIHGLWLVDDDAGVHVTQRTRPGGSSGALRRHCGVLPATEVTEVNGVRVTTIERTIVDCAKSMHPRDALVVADSGLRALLAPRRRPTPASAAALESLRTDLRVRVERGDRRRCQARAVIDHADPLSESPYETVIRWIGVSRGLPRPELQARFDINGRVYYTDLCWRLRVTEHGRVAATITVLVEYDGEIKYVPEDPLLPDARSLSSVVTAERRRENLLRSMPGTTVVRFDRRDVVNEAAVFRGLCAHFPARYVAALRPLPALLGPPRRVR